MTVFNVNNSGWKTKNYPLFMGEEMSLYDSVNVNYKELFDVYKQQVSQRWTEVEFNHEQSRLDMLSCPKGIYDVMLLNLSFQWVLDSVASRAIAPLFAPFVTNSELWAALMENSNMEVIHALSYSEIVRQCVADPNEVFKLSVQNDKTIQRAVKVVSVFDELQKAGAAYTLGIIGKNQETYNTVFKGLVALYILERLQFMASFAATFAVVEQGYFQSIGKMVQKIMLDEVLHVKMDYAIIDALMKEPEWKKVYEDNIEELTAILDTIIAQEEDWCDYLFSEGRVIVGLNAELSKQWVYFNAAPIYRRLKMKHKFRAPKQTPLAWMDVWLNPDQIQAAAQEIQRTDYKLNSANKDISDDEEFDF